MDITARSAWSLGTRPAGTPLSTEIAAPAILCLGDSITVGTGDPNSNSFRGYLHTLLTAGGLSPTWIGPHQNGDAPANRHRGVVGRTTVDHLADIDTIIGGGGSYHPDLIICFMGTNDANDATLTTNFATNYEALMNECHTLEPDARFVAVLLPTGGDANRRARIDTINGVLPTSIATLQSGGLLIATADCRVLTHGADMLRSESPSYLHPNPEGYGKIADALYPAVMNACGFAAQW